MFVVCVVIIFTFTFFIFSNTRKKDVTHKMKKTKEKNKKTPRESLLCIPEERFARKSNNAP